MKNGTIVKWNAAKGYGYITHKQGGVQFVVKETFFLHEDCAAGPNEPVAEGAEVIFDIVQDQERGIPRAVNVQVTEGGEK